jgi:hypothetical protein
MKELKPKVDPMRFIILNRSMAESLDFTPLEAQENAIMEPSPERFSTGEQVHADIPQGVVTIKGKVRLKAVIVFIPLTHLPHCLCRLYRAV